jgi:predicted nuclease with TOPRIM domain
MTKAKKLKLIKEINRLERELAAKKAQLAALEGKNSLLEQLKKRSPEEWQREFDDLIKEIGKHSSGGDSVEDQRRERERCK